jgi:hypothetical protein
MKIEDRTLQTATQGHSIPIIPQRARLSFTVRKAISLIAPAGF